MIAQPPDRANKAVSASLYVCAIITTALRIIRRSRTRLLWWDDAFAVASTVFIATALVAIFMWDTAQSASTRLALNWLTTLSFSNTLWLSRISMMISLVRLIPPLLTLRARATFCAGLFPFFWLSIVIHKICVCSKQREWMTNYICHQGSFMGIHGLILDVAADSALCFFPLRMFWQLTESRSKYRVLLILFSASMLTAITSILHAWAVLGPTGGIEGIMSNLEAATSVIVCNLAIVSSWIIRALGHHEQSREMEEYLSTIFLDDSTHKSSCTTAVCSFTAACGRVLSRGKGVFRAIRPTDVHDLEEQRSRSRSLNHRRTRDRHRRGAEYGGQAPHHIVLEEESKTEELEAELPVTVLEGRCRTGLEPGSDCLTTLSSALKTSIHTSCSTFVGSESLSPSPSSHPSPVHSSPSSGCVCAIEDDT